MGGEYGQPKSRLHEDMRNPWFLAVVGLVGVALIATVWMSVLAFSSAPQLVVKDYYETGKKYFHRQVENPATAWRMNLLPPQVTKVGTTQTYRLYAVSHDGEPLSVGAATLYAYRPNNSEADFSVSMHLQDAGQFVAEVSFPLPGNWDLIGQIEADGKKHDIALRVFIAD